MPAGEKKPGVAFDAATARTMEKSYLTPDIAEQRRRTRATLDLKPGDHVLDVGCGTGLLVADMAADVGPAGRVTGLDNSADMLRLARDRTDEVANVQLIETTVPGIPAEKAAFDAAVCVQLLLFIPDLSGLLAELHRVLRPGGRLCIVETDWRGVILNSADAELTRRLFAEWDAKAVNPNLPPRLAPLLGAAGFGDIAVETIPIINRDYPADNFSTDMVRGLAKIASDAGAVSADEAAAFLNDMDRKGRSDAYFFCIDRFLFTAVRR